MTTGTSGSVAMSAGEQVSASEIGSLWGNIFGSLVPIKTGYIVKWTGSFGLAFYLAGFLLFLAALVCFTMTRKPLNFEESVA
jgi:hypothetical protein